MSAQHIKSSETSFWAVKENALCRKLRVEGRLILTVKALYPYLISEEDAETADLIATSDAVDRFNTCYAEAARVFVDAGILREGRELEMQFLGVPYHERHTFLRHVLIATMSVSYEKPDCLCVTVTRSRGYGGIKGMTEEKILRHMWKFPEGVILCRNPSKT